MLPRRVVVLVNSDFESRASELEQEGPRGFEADAAVLDTAREVTSAVGRLGIEVSELRVTDSLRGVMHELQHRDAEVVFNLVESLGNDYGREPEVPRLLTRHGIAYTGNGAEVLALCRAKDRARKVLARAGVPVASGFTVLNVEALRRTMSRDLAFPLFVKPARVDGSIGVDRDSIVDRKDALERRVTLLLERFGGPVLVESFLPGKEINVALFPEPRRGHVVATEIDFSGVPAEYPRIITYDSKWTPQSPEYVSRSVPAELSAELSRDVEDIARRAFIALSGSGYGRVDMRLDSVGKPHVIDVNPNNDIHPDAGLSAAARSVGVSYEQLIESVLEHALEVSRASQAHHER